MIDSCCRICGSLNGQIAYDFGCHAYGDLFQTSREIAVGLQKYPLVLWRCSACNLLQLQHETEISTQYDNYLYFSGVTNNLMNYYDELARYLKWRLNLTEDSIIIDIGSNDGSFLKNFKDFGCSTLGVEPSKPASDFANNNQIETLNTYFSQNTVPQILSRVGKAKVISINYTIANLPNLQSFMENLNQISDDSSFISIVTGYHPDQFQINMFDYVGHDHLSYLTLQDITKLLRRFGWEVIEAERIEHKGGSLRVLAGKVSNKNNISPSVWQLMQREEWMKTHSNEPINELVQRVTHAADKLRITLNSIGQPIVGIGASISTSYLTSFLSLNTSLKELYDDDTRKIGLFSPGFGLKVKALEQLGRSAESFVLILAWQHKHKLIRRLREVGFKGQVIVPLPYHEILELS